MFGPQTPGGSRLMRGETSVSVSTAVTYTTTSNPDRCYKKEKLRTFLHELRFPLAHSPPRSLPPCLAPCPPLCLGCVTRQRGWVREPETPDPDTAGGAPQPPPPFTTGTRFFGGGMTGKREKASYGGSTGPHRGCPSSLSSEHCPSQSRTSEEQKQKGVGVSYRLPSSARTAWSALQTSMQRGTIVCRQFSA